MGTEKGLGRLRFDRVLFRLYRVSMGLGRDGPDLIENVYIIVHSKVSTVWSIVPFL